MELYKNINGYDIFVATREEIPDMFGGICIYNADGSYSAAVDKDVVEYLEQMDDIETIECLALHEVHHGIAKDTERWHDAFVWNEDLNDWVNPLLKDHYPSDGVAYELEAEVKCDKFALTQLGLDKFPYIEMAAALEAVYNVKGMMIDLMPRVNIVNKE